MQRLTWTCDLGKLLPLSVPFLLICLLHQRVAGIKRKKKKPLEVLRTPTGLAAGPSSAPTRSMILSKFYSLLSLKCLTCEVGKVQHPVGGVLPPQRVKTF